MQGEYKSEQHIIDVDNDVNKLRVCLADWVHLIRDILTSDVVEKTMIGGDGSIGNSRLRSLGSGSDRENKCGRNMSQQ